MPGPANSIDLTLYLVGVDPDTAATSMPYIDYADAAAQIRAAQPGDDQLRIFRLDGVLDLSTLTPVDAGPDDVAGDPDAVRVHEAPRREDVGLVGIDGQPGFPAWWDDDDRWNGWLNPGFTHHAAQEVVAWTNRCFDEAPDASDRLEWVGDNIVHHQPMYEGEAGYAPFIISPSEDGRYFIGGYSWTWCRVGELPSRIDRIVEAAKVEIRRDIASGRVPGSVLTFGELHDHVDANQYGGLCDPGRAADIGHEAAAIVQDRLDDWLQAGRPAA